MAKKPKQPKSKTMAGSRHWPSFIAVSAVLIGALYLIFLYYKSEAKPAPIPDLMDYQIDSLTKSRGFQLKKDYPCLSRGIGTWVPTYIFRNKGFYVLSSKNTQLDFYYQGEKFANYKLESGILKDLGTYTCDSIRLTSLLDSNRVVFFKQTNVAIPRNP